MNVFNVTDLRDWDIVKTRGGIVYYVSVTHNKLIRNGGYISLNSYNDNMLSSNSNSDIMIVIRLSEIYSLNYIDIIKLEDYEAFNSDIIWKRNTTMSIGKTYYVPSPSAKLGYITFVWMDDESDNNLLEKNLVYSNSEEAIRVTNEMLQVLK